MSKRFKKTVKGEEDKMNINQEPVVVPPVTSKLKLKGAVKVDVVKSADEDLNLNGDSDKSSAINPFQIEKIVDILMKANLISFFDFETLKSARLVCKLWNLKAIPILYQQSYFSVPTKFYRRSKEEQKSAISHMKKFLSTHQLLLPNLQILSRRDVATFCVFGDKDNNRCIGPFVSSLSYGVYDTVKPLENLLRRLKNLQFLDMHPVSKNDTNLPLQFCRELITVCAKVMPRQLILTDFSMFVNLREDPRSLDVFKYFSTMDNVRVQKLLFGIAPYSSQTIPDIRIQLSETLSTMLEKNPYLTSLCTWGSEMYLKETILPIMPCLQLFHWSVFPTSPSPSKGGRICVPAKYSFPPHFQLADSFPSLNNMGISYGYKEVEGTKNEFKGFPRFWELYFAGQKPVLSLKALAYCDFSHDFNLNPILRCFPNLELLHFSNPGDFSEAAKSIFTHGKNLQTLVLNIDLDSLTTDTSSFDSIFTGFTQQTVDKIMESPKDWDINEMLGEGMTLDSLRDQPSLFDLPNLEVLNIGIRGGKVKPLTQEIFAVAGKYAFSLLPKLKVQIYITKGCHEKCTLDALEKVFEEFSNVTISYN